MYPGQGEERWIAISVVDDRAWDALCGLGPPGLGDDERFATNEARLANVEALDEAIAAWTSGFDTIDLAARLQEAGVAAHNVATNEDILQDTHVMGRGFFQARPSSRFSRDLFTSSAIRMTATPGDWERAGPSMGEHTVDVLTRVAGLSEAEVDELVAAGAAFTMTEPDLQIDRPYEEWLHVFFPQDAVDSRDL